MPNRIIKESICSSDTINALSFFEETTLYRLWVNADDYGRLDARPDILKARLYPLKKGVTANQIEAAIRKLTDVGTLYVYEVDRKPYIQIVNWDKHQRIRNSVAKYPAPDNSPRVAASCGELRRVAASCGPTRAGAESESESESNPNPEIDARARVKHQYGEYKNVLLTDDELDKLKAEYADWADRIERLSGYIAAKGDQYKSHYAVIRNWARKDKEQTKPGSFDTHDFFDAAVKNAGDLAKELRRKFENE